MTIADLFINIGFKGTEKAKQNIEGVRAGLNEVRSTSLATKAAIVAAVYALERFTSAAAERGAQLSLFAQYTGLSTTMLQNWEQALGEVGVSSEETKSSIQGLQSAMTDLRKGNAPEGLNLVARVLGLGNQELDRMSKDLPFALEKLKQFAQITGKLPAEQRALANSAIASFRLSEGFVAGLRSPGLDLGKRRDTISPEEIKRLNEANKAWFELWNTLKLFTQHVTAAFGPELVKDLAFIVKIATDALAVLLQIPAAKSAAVAAFSGNAPGATSEPKEEDSSAISKFFRSVIKPERFQPDWTKQKPEDMAPNVKPQTPSTVNNSVHSTMNVTGVPGVSEAKEQIHSEIKRAHGQMQARTQAN